MDFVFVSREDGEEDITTIEPSSTTPPQTMAPLPVICCKIHHLPIPSVNSATILSFFHSLSTYRENAFSPTSLFPPFIFSPQQSSLPQTLIHLEIIKPAQGMHRQFTDAYYVFTGLGKAEKDIMGKKGEWLEASEDEVEKWRSSESEWVNKDDIGNDEDRVGWICDVCNVAYRVRVLRGGLGG